MEISKAGLSEYNFQVLIDRSGSMDDYHDGTLTRWKKAEEITKAVADFVAEVDDDGIDVIVFGGKDVIVHEKVSSDKVYEVFSNSRPSGATPLAEALGKAIDLHFKGGKKSFVTVVTDGVPNDTNAVFREIIGASQRLNTDSDLTFLFLQVGNDPSAREFLKTLDDNLKEAKYDIVDCKTASEYANMSFERLFYIAQND